MKANSLLVVTVLVFSPAYAAVDSPPPIGHTTLEYVYSQMANRLARIATASHQFYPVPDTLPLAVRLCEKIHPDAATLDSAFFGLEGWSYAYLRSSCLNGVAVISATPTLCDRITVIEGPPPRRLPAGRARLVTPDECRAAIRRGDRGVGHEEYGNEMVLLLLGYSRQQITDGAHGRLPEDGGAADFLFALLPGPTDEAEHVRRSQEFMTRLERLPDFSRGDDAARRQLDVLAPGWSSPGNRSRLALALRCAITRLAPGGSLSASCDDRMSG